MKHDVLATICATMVAFLNTASLPASLEKPGAIPGATAVAVYFLDPAGKPLPPEAIPGDLTLQLGAIPGSLGGSPWVPLQTIHIGHKKMIQLDLADLSAKLATRAAQFRESDETPLELTPQGTKFARVSTEVSFKSHAATALAVTFWDQGAKGSLALLYCDRPCRLRVPAASKLADDFDFDAPSAGLVWMLNKHDRHSRFTHVRAVNPHLVVIICPPEALDKVADNFVN